MKREFTGVIITAENYKEILEKEGREGINFHNKHLRSYKKGYERFSFGRDAKGILIFHKV